MFGGGGSGGGSKITKVESGQCVYLEHYIMVENL